MLVWVIQLQSAVVEGSLHCSSDEAIGLAGLQFRIEKVSEQCARTPDSLASPDSLLDVGGPCSMLQPISEDKEHHLQLEVPVQVSTPRQRQENVFNVATVTSPTVTDEPSTAKNVGNCLLRSYRCLCSRRRRKNLPERDPFGIVHKVHMYVPPDYREPKITAKLIKVSDKYSFIPKNRSKQSFLLD